MLLAREEPSFAVLRQQLRLSRVARREMTGAGFYTYLEVAATAPRLATPTRQRTVSGVLAEIEGLQHGAGFILFIVDGLLDNLEGFSYDEPWPATIGAFRLKYTDEDSPALSGPTA
jgi:hypothetical protein